MKADSGFSETDFIGDTLRRAQVDNKTLAYPLTIEPAVLQYDPEQFANAGVPIPSLDKWTVSEFVDALKQLKAAVPNTTPFEPIVTSGSGLPNQGVHLLVLIAGYGGLPIDFRTEPPTLDFTSPTTVEAIRQVLDLAKNGYMAYFPLGLFGAAPRAAKSNLPLYTTVLNPYTFRSALVETARSPYRLTFYPQSGKLRAISYDIQAAFILPNTKNPYACYRLIKKIASHPELFGVMPARLSELDNSVFVASQGADIVAAYKRFSLIMQSPELVSFPLSAPTFQAAFDEIWLYQAFDNYILHDRDLLSSLENAKTKAAIFDQCYSPLSTYDALSSASVVYIRALIKCVKQADPSLSIGTPQ